MTGSGISGNIGGDARDGIWAVARGLAAPVGIVAALSFGVMTGFFFAFSNPTMMGFRQVDAQTYIASMQAINVAVRNLPFFIAFAAPLPLALLAALVGRPRWPWLGAFCCYAGAVAVTRQTNIPINDAMALWDPTAPPAAWATIRDQWASANDLRGALTCIGFILALWGVRRTK